MSNERNIHSASRPRRGMGPGRGMVPGEKAKNLKVPLEKFSAIWENIRSPLCLS